MALQTQLLDVPITGGLAQHVDDRVVEPGSFIDLRNVQYTKRGRLVKRRGYDVELPNVTGTSVTGGKDSFARRGLELLAVQTESVGTLPLQTERWLSTYSEAEAGWKGQDTVCPFTVSRSSLARSQTRLHNPHVVRTNGRLLVFWVSPGIAGGSSCYGKVLDETTGAVIVPEKELIADAVQIVAFEQVAGIATVVYVDNRTFHVKACWVEGDLATVGGTTILSPPFVNAYSIDAVRISDSQLFVGYLDVALAASLINVGKWQYNAGGNYTAVGVGFTTGPSASPVGISLSYAGGATPRILVCFGDNGTLRAQAFNAATYINTWAAAADTYITLSALGCYLHTDASAYVTWFGTNVADEDQTACIPISAAGVAGTSRRRHRTAIVTRPWLSTTGLAHWGADVWQRGRSDVQACHGVWVYSGTFDEHVDLVGACCEAEAFPSYVASGWWEPLPAALVGPSSTQRIYPKSIVQTKGAAIGDTGLGLDLLTLDSAAQQSGLHRYAEAQGCTVLTGALTSWYDGQGVCELGFLQVPEVKIATEVLGAGSIAAGTYLYRTTYEWVDAQGNRHESEPSEVVTVVAAGPTSAVDLQCLQLPATRKGQYYDGERRDPAIVVYRTIAGGTVFYRATSRITGGNRTNRTNFALTIRDTLSDAQLTALGYGFLYTDSGLLPSQGWGATRSVVSHKNRLWAVSSDDPATIYYSSEYLRGEPPQWSAERVVRIEDATDGVTALASLDQYLVVFTPTRTYVIAGDGPNNQGAGAFQQPTLVSRFAGCVDARSVASTQIGVLFYSESGYKLLTSSVTIEDVGAPVQDTVEALPICLGATVDEQLQRVYWLVTDGNANNNQVLVFDYRFGAWYRWTFSGEYQPTAHTYHDGRHIVADDAGVWANGGQTDHGGVWVTSLVRTPWLRLGALEGFARCRHVVVTGKKLEDCNVTVSVERDYGSATDDTVFDLGPATTLVTPDVLKLDKHVAQQTAASFRVSIADSAHDDGVMSGADQPAGIELAGITVELGIKPGRNKIATQNRQ